jgi:hypothetical protein
MRVTDVEGKAVTIGDEEVVGDAELDGEEGHPDDMFTEPTNVTVMERASRSSAYKRNCVARLPPTSPILKNTSLPLHRRIIAR